MSKSGGIFKNRNVIAYIGTQFANPYGFGGILSSYFMNLLNKRQYKCVMDVCYRQKPECVLDIGFGNGYLLHQLSQKYEAEFYGIELSADMLDKASKRNKRQIRSGQMHLVFGNVTDMEYADKTFDYLYTVNTVYFWEDLEKGYQEIKRTMKRGGVFANVFYTKKWLDKLSYTKFGFTKYAHLELLNSVRQMGFSKVRMVELQKDKSYCILVWK